MGPAEQVLDPAPVSNACGDPQSVAFAQSKADIGSLSGQAFVVGTSGGSTASSGWVDTVTFLPPKTFTGTSISVALNDSYDYTITGYVPPGQTVLAVCYEFPSLGINDCAKYKTDGQQGQCPGLQGHNSKEKPQSF